MARTMSALRWSMPSFYETPLPKWAGASRVVGRVEGGTRLYERSQPRTDVQEGVELHQEEPQAARDRRRRRPNQSRLAPAVCRHSNNPGLSMGRRLRSFG